jgi:RNA polymerase sigma-70 factor (ECF subfamily)
MERRFPGPSPDDHPAAEGPPPLPALAGPRPLQLAVDAGATHRAAGDRVRNMAERASLGGRILGAGPLGMPAEQTAPDRDAPQHVSGIDNAELVAALVRGEGRAWTLLVDRFGRDVERLVAGALGVDADIADIVQDVFVRVMERIHQLRDPAALKGWISSVAVFAARGHIRKRRRWRWIRFLAPSDIPDTPAATASPESHAILRATYKVLEALPENERLAFSLRFISEMELTEVAAACGVSLATIKRRLARAEVSFLEGARRDPMLIERIERGERWKSP